MSTENTICLGDIVWVSITDPNGRNRKPRPTLVVTQTNDIENSETMVVVAISTEFDPDNIEDSHVKMLWSQGGHPRSSLDEPCVAKCEWQRQVKVSDVRRTGCCTGKQLYRVLEVLTQLSAN